MIFFNTTNKQTLGITVLVSKTDSYQSLFLFYYQYTHFIVDRTSCHTEYKQDSQNLHFIFLCVLFPKYKEEVLKLNEDY